MASSSREPLLLVRSIQIDSAVYRTDLPLIVAERCRNPGRADDGTKPEPPKLIATWYALRWLMAAFPKRRGFGQRAIAAIAGMDQKYVHKHLRTLARLEVVSEVGRETYKHLTGKDHKPKERPIYSIPLQRLDGESATRAAELVAMWEQRLFGGEVPPPAAIHPAQIVLDLSDPIQDQTPDPIQDQTPDPIQDQPDPMQDQTPDPIQDQSDPMQDQTPDPIQDQASDPAWDHMEGERERERDADSATRSRTPPKPPPGGPPLAEHPLDFWPRATSPSDLDESLLAALAAEHDAPTGGHGWYWLGRALYACRMGGPKDDLLGAVRKTLRRWRDTDSYGSDAPASARPRRQRPDPAPALTPTAGDRLSDLPILHARIDGRTRQRLLTTFRRARAAGDIDTQIRILNDLPGRPHDESSPGTV